jgi:hypothetical protein
MVIYIVSIFIILIIIFLSIILRSSSKKSNCLQKCDKHFICDADKKECVCDDTKCTEPLYCKDENTCTTKPKTCIDCDLTKNDCIDGVCTCNINNCKGNYECGGGICRIKSSHLCEYGLIKNASEICSPPPLKCDPKCQTGQSCIGGNCVDCMTADRSNPPPNQRKTRDIIFYNNGNEEVIIYMALGDGMPMNPLNIPAIQPQKYEKYTITLKEKTDKTPSYYVSPMETGMVFIVMPSDGDVTNSTRLEIGFAENGDFYNLSTIPPSASYAHINPNDVGFPPDNAGYSDHLPFKDINKYPSLTSSCLGNDCGDGYGYYDSLQIVDPYGQPLIDPITNKAYTQKAPQITDTYLDPATGKEVTFKYGCGVDNEQCCALGLTKCEATDSHGLPLIDDPRQKVTDCCPYVCSTYYPEKNTDGAVRDRLYGCAYLQSNLVNEKLRSDGSAVPVKRNTGYYKGMSVYPIMPKGQSPECNEGNTLVAEFPNGNPIDPLIKMPIQNISSYTQGYVYGYDDLSLGSFYACPDYLVVISPFGEPVPSILPKISR